MKTILLIINILIISNISISQTNNCKSGRTGTFELVSTVSGRTIIERSADKQTETNDTLKIIATYDVIWTDSCRYELRNKRLVKGDSKYAGLPTDILKVEILKVEGEKVFIKSSSNYSDRVVERTLTKIK